MAFERKASALFLGAALAVAVHGAVMAQQPANPRIALVIGEAAYPDHPLATTANDAGLVAQTLQAAGFDVVGARDLDEKSLRQAFRDFIDKSSAAGPDGIDFVYLSGRALQYAGDNYFVPVDARIARDVDVPIETVKLADFTHALAAIAGRAHIVVVDGARANNYAAETPLAPGLALVDAEKGELIAFNAAPGTLAPDETGPYGVYGKDLAGALRQGGVPLEDIFAQVRLQVNQDTQGAVVPWSAANLAEPVYIFERAADTPPPPVIAASRALAGRPLRALGAKDAYAAALERDTLDAYQEYLEAYPHAAEARRVRAMLAARREAAYWRRALRENTPRAYWTYLKRYPNGPHVADAARRLAFLSAPEAPPADFEPVEFADLPPPPPDEEFYEERPVAYFGGDDFGPPPPPPPPDFAPHYGEEWRDLPPPPPPREYGYLPVLPIAIPLIAGAVAVERLHERHERRETEERNGVAPPGRPGARAPGKAAQTGQSPAPTPAAPPPLPKGVAVKPPPPPQPAPAKLLIPGTPGARPVSTAPAALKPAAAPPQPAGGQAAPQPGQRQPPSPAGHAPATDANGAPPAPQAPAGHALPQPAPSQPLQNQPQAQPPAGHALPQPAPSQPPNGHAQPRAQPPAGHASPPGANGPPAASQAPAGHALPQPAPSQPPDGHAQPQAQPPAGHASPPGANGPPAASPAPAGHALPQPTPPQPQNGHAQPQSPAGHAAPQAPVGHALPQPTPSQNGHAQPQTQAPTGHAAPQPPASHALPQPAPSPAPAPVGHAAPQAQPPARHAPPLPAAEKPLAPQPKPAAPSQPPALQPKAAEPPHQPPPAPHPVAPPPAAHAAPSPPPASTPPPAAHAAPPQHPSANCGGKAQPPCPK